MGRSAQRDGLKLTDSRSMIALKVTVMTCKGAMVIFDEKNEVHYFDFDACGRSR